MYPLKKIIGCFAVIAIIFAGAAALPAKAKDGAQDKPGAAAHNAPLAGMGPGLGFKEEPDSFTVNAPKGKFQVVIDPSGRAMRKAIHQARSKRFYAGKSVSQAQAEMEQNETSQGAKLEPLASAFIGITQDGHLVGAEKPTGGEFDPYQLWSYDLNEKGDTARVILTGGKIDKTPALIVRVVDTAGQEKSWVMLTADSTVWAGWGD